MCTAKSLCHLLHLKSCGALTHLSNQASINCSVMRTTHTCPALLRPCSCFFNTKHTLGLNLDDVHVCLVNVGECARHVRSERYSSSIQRSEVGQCWYGVPHDECERVIHELLLSCGESCSYFSSNATAGFPSHRFPQLPFCLVHRYSSVHSENFQSVICFPRGHTCEVISLSSSSSGLVWDLVVLDLPVPALT